MEGLILRLDCVCLKGSARELERISVLLKFDRVDRDTFDVRICCMEVRV